MTRLEAIAETADAIEARQARSTTAFLAAVATFRRTVAEIDWPLGCLIPGYDQQTILDQLDMDFTQVSEPARDAFDLAGEMV